MVRKLVIGCAAAMLCAVMMAGPVQADGRSTNGFGGWHSEVSHGWNPAHLWLVVGSPADGHVMSGGRFHTNCDWWSAECTGAFHGTDWALDVGNVGDMNAYLSVRYGGWGSGGVTPDNNRSIVFEAEVVNGGNLRQDLPGMNLACEWQQYRIEASFWDTNGTFYSNLPVGALWYAHLTNWTYGIGDRIPANTATPNPYGWGTVYSISGVVVGQAFEGGDTVSSEVGGRPCSEGTHTHVEGFSSHGWGFLYEWHSPAGPDGYSGLMGYLSEIVSWYATEPDIVVAGQDIGALGGGTTQFWLRDNPWRWEY